MKILLIICIILSLVTPLLIIFIMEYNKFKLIKIKLDKGERKLNDNLKTKYKILLRYYDLLKENIHVSEENYTINFELSINDINSQIESFNNVINQYMNDNEKLLNNKDIASIDKELKNIDILLNSSKKYYSDNLTQYNSLCTKFPSNIVARICHYKEKDYIKDHVDELKILK